jgi:hypothetical protein
MNLALRRAGRKGADGVLGAEMLSKQKAILDYASGRLYLKDVLR